MLRRQARLRREFVYRKSIESKKRAVQEKKQLLKQAIEANKEIPSHIQREALELEGKLDWDDEGGEGVSSSIDDEYRWAGVKDPKIMITTSRDPSSRLKIFAKEMKLLLPNSQRINRGNYEVHQLVDACAANEVTDLVVVNEHRGNPDGLIICHMPHGPTAYFTLANTVMRHDVPGTGPMSEAYPHLIFNNLTSKLGKRVQNILKYLFPVPKEDSRRMLTFSNEDDFISFRHHVYKRTDGKHIELTEVGPRFEMKLYKILLGTIDKTNTADVEWVFKPYMRTTKKRQFLSSAEQT